MASTTNDATSKAHGNNCDALHLLPGDTVPPFYQDLHTKYIVGLSDKLDAPTSYEGAVTEHLRMSGVYWSLTALSLLHSADDVDRLMGLTGARGSASDNNEDRSAAAPQRPDIVTWVLQCFDERSGGFGGNIGHDGHLLYTLSALQILALADRLEDERFVSSQIKARVIDFCAARQQPDGSFTGDEWGEIDTRFTYCALSSLSILNSLGRVNVPLAAEFIMQCRNFDGGFGCTMGAESHAGQVFTCIGALSIAKCLHLLVDNDDDNSNDGCGEGADLLSWWLAERQCDSGGLNGRPEKQADVCYSWWILSVLSIFGRVSWINRDKLATFILKCQDDEDGGIADRPEDMADVFHTFFGIAGLSLLGHLHDNKNNSNCGEDCRVFRQIDPVYALPTDVVKRLGLQGQVMIAHEGDPVDERLQDYNVLVAKPQLFT